MRRKVAFASASMALMIAVSGLPAKQIGLETKKVIADTSENDTEYVWQKDMSNTVIGANVIARPLAPNGTTDPWRGTYLYYGKVNGEPVKYRVLNTNDTNNSKPSILVDCDTVLFQTAFDTDSDMFYWGDSSLMSQLNGGLFLTRNGVFTEPERDAIMFSYCEHHAFTVGTDAGNVSAWTANTFTEFTGLYGERIFILDAEDVSNKDYGYYYYDGICACRVKNYQGEPCSWFLRTPTKYMTFPGIINQYGSIVAENQLGVAPAFKIDKSSILFTSIVEGCDEDTGAGAEIKLTLLDEKMQLSRPETEAVYMFNGKMNIPYKISGNDAGKATRLSVIITDGSYVANDSTLLYYGPLDCGDSFTTQGRGTFTLPEDIWGLLGEDYHLYIVAEDMNGEHETDYASNVVEIASFEPAVMISETEFPDANFRNFVKAFDKDSDGALSVEELDGVKAMNCSSKNIYSLKGIEYFYDLIVLRCNDNHLSELNLSELYMLKNIYCQENEIREFILNPFAPILYVDLRMNCLSYAPEMPNDQVNLKFEPQNPVISNLSAKQKAEGTARLTWNSSYVADRYEVWRATSKNGTYTRVATAAKVTAFENRITASGTYYYKVRGFVTYNNVECAGAFSEVVSVNVKGTTNTPTPTKKATVTPTKKATVTPTKKATVTPTKKVTPTPTKKVTPTPTKKVTPTPTKKVTPTPTKKVTPTPTKKATPTPTKKATPTPTKKATPTPTKKATPTPTKKATPTPTKKATPTPTKKATPTPTKKATPTPTKKATPTPTKKATPTPTKKATPTPTKKATPTPTKKATPTPAK
ncbi:MAG: hypothetical protein IKG93_03595 [Clostridiales bacterium]|nr:hypothetical protein [Clostridiales bacterium]